jgi:trehalose/maltose hydrolase-like predicted phosphorylase
MYPWQSGSSGVETCPSYASYGIVREIHLNGDISAAVKLVWDATGDVGWLNATGWPLLRAVAAFYVSRLAHDNPGALNGSTAPLHLLDVCGPDEEHDHVSDSVYTNAVAALALLAARDAALALGLAPDPVWADAAGRIALPTNATPPGGGAFNNSGAYHPEFAGYAGAVVKQADVVLLGFPLGLPMPPSTRANDLEVYAARTDPGGPAMTWSMYSIGFCELGPAYEGAAAAFFNKSFASNVQAPFGVWREGGRGGGCPNFLTGAGGFLQALLHGYTGMRVNSTALAFTNPRVPEGATAVTLRGVAYQGSRLSVAIGADALTVGVTGVAPSPSGGTAAPPALQLIDAAGAAHPLAAGKPVALPLQSFAVTRA